MLLLQLILLELVLPLLVVQFSEEVTILVQVETDRLVGVLFDLGVPIQLLVDHEFELAFEFFPHALLAEFVVRHLVTRLGRSRRLVVSFHLFVLFHVEHGFVFQLDDFLE